MHHKHKRVTAITAVFCEDTYNDNKHIKRRFNMTTYTAKHKPADIAKVSSRPSELFRGRQIDFRGGWAKPLKDVIAEANRHEDAILAKSNEACDEWKQQDHAVSDWDAMPATKLIDHIVQTHHSC